MLSVMLAGQSQAGSAFDHALATSKPLIESNLRLENVDQAGIANRAEALTWRNRIGWQTGAFHNWTALVEIEATAAAVERYNSTVNGKTAYPTVTDPQVVELHRAQLQWAPSKTTSLTIGRQRIILDDARFVGNSGWRQDDQVFDAVRFDTAVGRLNVTTAYLSRIDRIVGDEKDWNSRSYLLNANYPVSTALKLTGFAYVLRFSTAATNPVAADATNARASSVDIAGLRAAGSAVHGKTTFGYVAQYASERNAGQNPQSFHLSESMVEVSAATRLWSGKLNYEMLGGNGTVGFVAPLTSAHAFQGFADAFSATGGNKTFAAGLKDLNATVAVNLPGKLKPVLSTVWHDFRTDVGSARIGTEWDAVATVQLTPHLSAMLKYADFEKGSAVGAPASRTKTWVALQYKL